ncbi:MULTISPECIES: hypothetical protein [Streptomyces]|uniref:hypothetical protein n=1 Tax=Streptomyces TaxID=1883 RepID=UPI000241A4FC|nr:MULTISPECIES: hypothetical protein [Streptomyces]EHM25293.1 hypothetical protein SPW_6338 [Streptomyces sp. W007]MCX4508695.1 hypothetical protein [Streptomyces anulatus]WTD26934.1 hypothetical protein OH737_21450 [Streptomyces anulatus]
MGAGEATGAGAGGVTKGDAAGVPEPDVDGAAGGPADALGTGGTGGTGDAGDALGPGDALAALGPGAPSPSHPRNASHATQNSRPGGFRCPHSSQITAAPR